MVPTADLVMFGIRAALRLRDEYRRGFADATLNLALVLPLPNFPAQPDVSSARGFYNGDGQEFLNSSVNEFVDNGAAGTIQVFLNKPALTAQEKDALMRTFSTHFAMIQSRSGALFGASTGLQKIGADDINALLSLRQWRDGQDPNPSLLRRMSGTLVNLAVDYLQNIPGVVSETSARGQALHGFLEGIESINFAEASRQEIITGLFSHALEAVRDHPELFVHGGNARELVKQAAGGLAGDIQKVLESGTQLQKDNVGDWGNLVFRSLLNSAGRLVVEQPQRFLGVRAGVGEELVQRVGQAVLATVIDDQFVNLGRLFTPEALDQLVKASLIAVGHHPEILGTDNKGIRNIVTQLATDLSQSTAKLGKDFFLEAARLVIEKTGENLEVLMPGGLSSPAGNLLIVGLKETMKQLSAPPAAGAKWKLEFTAAEAREVASVIVDLVVSNPEWVNAGTGGAGTLIGDVTKAVLDTVRAIAPSDRISRSTVIAILRAALSAATVRFEFMIPEQNRMLVSLAIDAVLSPILAPGVDPAVKWALLRDEMIRELMETAFRKLARFGVTAAQIQKTRQVVTALIDRIKVGGKFSIEDFAAALDTALA